MKIADAIVQNGGMMKLAADRGAATIEPFGDTVVIRPMHFSRTSAGLHVPEDAEALRKQSKMQGTVMAIGPDVNKREMTTATGAPQPTVPIKVGDEVVVSRFVESTPDGLEGETYLLAPAHAILGKIVRGK
jgi:co-chaperonin GroES (HSP10)